MVEIKKLKEEIKLLKKQKELLEFIVELKKVARELDEEQSKYIPYPIPYPQPYPIYPKPYNPWDGYTWIYVNAKLSETSDCVGWNYGAQNG